MTKLPQANGFEVAKALQRLGFDIIRFRGSHLYLQRPGAEVVCVPQHRASVPAGTLRSIVRQAGITVQELVDVL